MTPEGKIVQRFNRLCSEYGFSNRKVSYEGRIGAPDRLLLMPGHHAFFELKAPGKKPMKAQLVEHQRLREAGFLVYVVDNEPQLECIFKSLSNMIKAEAFL